MIYFLASASYLGWMLKAQYSEQQNGFKGIDNVKRYEVIAESPFVRFARTLGYKNKFIEASKEGPMHLPPKTTQKLQW